MEYLRRISRERGITIVVNLHQLDAAKQYSDRIIGLNGGRIVYNGNPDDIDSDTISRIYGSKLDELIVE